MDVPTKPGKPDPRRPAQALSKGHGERLSRKQEDAIAALLTEPTVGGAARVVGVHPTTLRTWLKVPEFLAAFTEAKNAILLRTVAKLQVAAGKAVDAIVRRLDSTNDDTALQAAKLLLEKNVQTTAQLDISERLKAIEGKIHGGPAV